LETYPIVDSKINQIRSFQMCKIRPFEMQTLPVGKYHNHVHKSQTETPEKLEERLHFMA